MGRAAAEGTTASAPNRPRFDGRPDHGAAAARTEQLFADHGRLLSGLCRALLRDHAEAEEEREMFQVQRDMLVGFAVQEKQRR